VTTEPGTRRPAAHIAAVRDDALQAADNAAALTGQPPDYLIPYAIDWAEGRPAPAPFTGKPTAAASPEDLQAEISACETYLTTTNYSDETAQQLEDARDVLELLRWITGKTDKPPAYSDGTLPGDLVGGRGVIVRSTADLTALATAARTGTGPRATAVAATLAWLAGTGPAPMAHPEPGPCTHPAPQPGGPGEQAIIREQRAAEEHAEPGGYRHGTHTPAYAAAVTGAIRWALGDPEQPLS